MTLLEGGRTSFAPTPAGVVAAGIRTSDRSTGLPQRAGATSRRGPMSSISFVTGPERHGTSRGHAPLQRSHPPTARRHKAGVT